MYRHKAHLYKHSEEYDAERGSHHRVLLRNCVGVQQLHQGETNCPSKTSVALEQLPIYLHIMDTPENRALASMGISQAVVNFT